MIKWQDLNRYQKAAFWLFIGIAGWFAPEIALAFQFGGVEVVFAIMTVYLVPVLKHLQHWFQSVKTTTEIACIAMINSASTQPRVFAVQASFCCAALLLTGSTTFAVSFFMPGMLFNGLLT
ncbi:hypothetical protein [Neptunicella marina]|uniref:Uncharacterized protein n=1 Tax=Neptunicella marina TaxID=2125989 RepID=A0A8J6M0C8_9ALTE|nr:hypothetical protein [Neptunicella marina]MBC3764767.1 hypothetical protein [Neptunicella marina]